MSNQRVMLLAAAVVLVALVLLLANPFVDSVHQEGSRSQALVTVAVKDIEGVSIQSPEETVELTRAGSSWVVSSKDMAPADTLAVGRALRAMVAAQLGNVVSQNPEKRSVFEVTPEQGVTVTLQGGGESLGAFTVGKAGPGFGSSYVQRQGENEVYLVRGLSQGVLARPEGYRDRRMTSFDPGGVTALAWAAADTGWGLVKQDTLWMVSSREVQGEADPAQVQTMLQQASRLTADSFADGALENTGLDQPAYELRITLAGGNEMRVSVGNQDPSQRRFAKRSDRDAVYLLSEWNLNQFKKRARALLKPE